MRIRSVLAHSTQAVLEGALVSLLVVGLMAGTAFAAKGGRAGGGTTSGDSLALVLASGDTVANHGDTVTFAVSTAATRPFVSLNCYVSGTLVYSASVGFFPDYPWSQNFVLSSNGWTSGAADCTARLYTTRDGVRTTTLATLAVRVEA
ncbi:MAG TPA: hypothetical protein VM427_05695 [Patescibacteria group bacterium]|nr:hypothetical protein [Patescibacteria group bacterium]